MGVIATIYPEDDSDDEDDFDDLPSALRCRAKEIDFTLSDRSGRRLSLDKEDDAGKIAEAFGWKFNPLTGKPL